MSMTRRQCEAITFIRYYKTENGIPPTYAEICAELNLASKSGVHRILRGLQERGLIKITPSRARSIEIVDRDPLLDVLGPQLTAAFECLSMQQGVPARTLIREACRAYSGEG